MNDYIVEARVIIVQLATDKAMMDNRVEWIINKGYACWFDSVEHITEYVRTACVCKRLIM